MCVWKHGGVENEQVAAALLFAYVFVWGRGRVVGGVFSCARQHTVSFLNIYLYSNGKVANALIRHTARDRVRVRPPPAPR